MKLTALSTHTIIQCSVIFICVMGQRGITLAQPVTKSNPAQSKITPVTQPQRVFRYDPKRGVCLNAKGERGHNQIDIKYLFDGLTDAALKAPHYQPKRVYRDKLAECVDFSGFDFNRIIKFSYVTFEGWNLRGAVLSGAAFSFADMTKVDLSGADLRGISIGYTHIDGRADRFTRHSAECSVTPEPGQREHLRVTCDL